jgi:hypothetical protein
MAFLQSISYVPLTIYSSLSLPWALHIHKPKRQSLETSFDVVFEAIAHSSFGEKFQSRFLYINSTNGCFSRVIQLPFFSGIMNHEINIIHSPPPVSSIQSFEDLISVLMDFEALLPCFGNQISEPPFVIRDSKCLYFWRKQQVQKGPIRVKCDFCQKANEVNRVVKFKQQKLSKFKSVDLFEDSPESSSSSSSVIDQLQSILITFHSKANQFGIIHSSYYSSLDFTIEQAQLFLKTLNQERKLYSKGFLRQCSVILSVLGVGKYNLLRGVNSGLILPQVKTIDSHQNTIANSSPTFSSTDLDNVVEIIKKEILKLGATCDQEPIVLIADEVGVSQKLIMRGEKLFGNLNENPINFHNPTSNEVTNYFVYM